MSLKIAGDAKKGKLLKMHSGDELRRCRSIAETDVGDVRIDRTTLVVSAGRNSVSIGSRAQDQSAVLSITSTTKGLLLPRMSTAQRNAITSPTNGLLVYNLTTNKVQARVSGAWVDLH